MGGEWVLVIVVVAGFTLSIRVWKKITEPVVPPPPPMRDPAAVETEITNLLTGLGSIRQDIINYGSVNSEFCPEAIRLAKRIIILLNEYKTLPGRSQATYDRMKSGFEQLEIRLDSWCTEYDPPALI